MTSARTRAQKPATLSASEHRLLAHWAAACAERVLPHFEGAAPGDQRPRLAIEACRRWADTGAFAMVTIRGASLAAHAAARSVDDTTAARFAARAAGQAVATAHVPSHALGAAWYAAKATDVVSADDGARERAWQWTNLPPTLRAFVRGVCAAKPTLGRALRYPAVDAD